MIENLRKLVIQILFAGGASLVSNTAFAAPITFGAAPSGDATTVAGKIIKYNFPACKHVKAAKRLSDGSIIATCNGSDFRVFTIFNQKEGRLIDLAMNCSVLKKRLDIDCL